MTGIFLCVVGDLQWVVGASLAMVVGLGLLATIAPHHFAQLAARGGQWVDTKKVLEVLDKSIDIDEHVLRYSRVFGVIVAASALWLGYVYWTYIVH